jgi:hypothetical protein
MRWLKKQQRNDDQSEDGTRRDGKLNAGRCACSYKVSWIDRAFLP